jgi:hypothetical protein
MFSEETIERPLAFSVSMNGGKIYANLIGSQQYNIFVTGA